MLVCKFDYQNESISLNVDFKMETGVLGIVGRSGAGKSTFLKNIVGIHKPTRGLIELNHTKIVDIENNIFIPMHKRKIAKKLNLEQKKLLIALLIGDGTISSNYVFKLSHGEDQLEYLN